MAGVRNLVVFGRAITNALQNLKNIAPDFDGWYEPLQSEMKADPLMKFFYDIRSEILKQGELRVHSKGTFSGNPFELSNRYRSQQPPNALGFVIGDQLGGSGWLVRLPDGSTEMCYVEIPSDIQNFDLAIDVYFSKIPEQFRGVPVKELCEKYISYLENMVNDAKQRFSDRDA